MATCSVVMVTNHLEPMLFASIKSVLRQQQLAELVVVDCGNPPDVLARLQQMALTEPRLKIMTGQNHAGFAKAYNLGVTRASGDYLLLLSPDCFLPPDALEDTLAAFAEVPGAVLAGCCLLDADGTAQPPPRLLTPPFVLLEMLGLHRLRRRRRHPQGMPPPDRTHEVAAISDAFMCIRQKDYLILSGMDEGFSVAAADQDFCVRIHKGRGKIIMVPQVQVVRVPDASPDAGRVAWQSARDLLHYFDKHFKGEYIFGFLPLVKLAVMARAALKSVLCRRWRQPSVKLHSAAEKRLMVLASWLTDLQESREMSGRTVLVTGATGQVGLCIIRRLIASGASVLALSRGNAVPFRHERLRWIKGDLSDPNLDLQSYLIDIVVHCASLLLLPPILELLARSEVKRIIAFGTTSLYTKSQSKNAYEKTFVDNLGRAEAAIAEYCNAAGVSWTILRPTLIYGVGLDANVSSLVRCICRFGFFPVYPPAFGRRQPVHADDLALAVMQALFTPVTFGKTYNLSGGEILTYRQMLERLFTLCRKKTRIVETTILPFALDVAGWMTHRKDLNGEIARRMNDDLIFFHDDAARDFGFTPRAFLSGGLRDIQGF